MLVAPNRGGHNEVHFQNILHDINKTHGQCKYLPIWLPNTNSTLSSLYTAKMFIFKLAYIAQSTKIMDLKIAHTSIMYLAIIQHKCPEKHIFTTFQLLLNAHYSLTQICPQANPKHYSDAPQRIRCFSGDEWMNVYISYAWNPQVFWC